MYGWIRDDAAVAQELKTLSAEGLPATFSETQVWQAADDAPDDVFGWLFVERASGKPYFNKNQKSVGSCVSFGTNTTVEAVEAAEITQGDLEDWTSYVEEVTYGGSRVEIGGGTIRGDGSVGAWAARFLKQYGLVPRGKYGNYDLTAYDESTCRSFGRNGVPSELEDVARKFPVKSYVQVSNAEECWKSVGNLNFVAVCSDVGFEGSRDSDGIIRARGSWGHCMAIIGRAVINGKRYFFIQNSWERMPGPIGYGNHPIGGFWAAYETVDSMLRQNDSWSFAGVSGFTKKTIDWSVM